MCLYCALHFESRKDLMGNEVVPIITSAVAEAVEVEVRPVDVAGITLANSESLRLPPTQNITFKKR